MDKSVDLELAKKYNQLTWSLIEKDARDSEDDLLMISYAHTSLAHWIAAGTIVHKVRGYWLLSRVYCLVGDARNALLYAKLCEQLTSANKSEMADFDLAYAAECLARAYAMAGEVDNANGFLAKADMLGGLIADPEDRDYYQKDRSSEPWFGLIKSKNKFCNG
mgnify:CR=1 FL=1